MPGGYKNIGPEDGKKFSSDYQPEVAGRKPSIRKQLQKVLVQGGYITFPKNQVEILEDVVRVEVPSEMAIAAKLLEIAMGKFSNSFNALKFIAEWIDGRAPQSLKVGGDFQNQEPIKVLFRGLKQKKSPKD